MVTGYLHPGYAQSLAEFGTPRWLSRCNGWILERQIPEFPYHDAMGCYPLFDCQDWPLLYADLEDIGSDLVCLSLVADPFGEYDEDYLHRCFADVVIPFKEHYVVDLEKSIDSIVSKHHRYYARRALKQVHIDICNDPPQFAEEWTGLSSNLTRRHALREIKAFSRAAFAKQLSIPGVIVFRGVFQNTTVGAHLWYVQGDVAYSHLAAYSDLGYELMASYALYWSAINYFVGKMRWLDIGAGAGTAGNITASLSQFKRGWSSQTRRSYFCGRVFDQAKYSEILRTKSIPPTNYFPAYRMGEFD